MSVIKPNKDAKIAFSFKDVAPLHELILNKAITEVVLKKWGKSLTLVFSCLIKP